MLTQFILSPFPYVREVLANPLFASRHNLLRQLLPKLNHKGNNKPVPEAFWVSHGMVCWIVCISCSGTERLVRYTVMYVLVEKWLIFIQVSHSEPL